MLGWSQNRRGEAYTKQAADMNETDQADHIAELDALALADFEASVASDPAKWKSVHNRGVSYALIGKYGEAVADFSRVIELNPRFANAWFNRGEIRYEQEKYDEAIGDYTQAIGLDPDDAGAYTARGHAYFQMRRFRDAVNDYNRAVSFDRNNAEPYANRGDAYHSLRNWSQAASDYRRAIQLDDQLGRAYQSAAWLMATCPDARYRTTDLAVRAAERAVSLDGAQDYRNLDTLAAAYANAGRFDDAKAKLEKALEITPDGQLESLKARLALFEDGEPYRQ